MASSLGKRSRSRVTRSYVNDENKRPVEEVPESDVEEEIENDEITIFSPAVTSTPSARRTKNVYKLEAIEYPFKVPITPSTPRHRDVFAKTPSTPRHRVMSVGRLSCRMTPKTPLTPTAAQTIYHQARQLFSRSADPGQLIGRDEERNRLREFLARRDAPQPHGCVYVSGPPGTGKSAMVNEITNEVVAESTTIRKAYVNCMSIKSSKDLYMTLVGLLCDQSEIEEEDAVVMLQKMFVPRKKAQDVSVVVLDEIDHILSLDLESLYRVFEWSMQKSSRLLLVGIANALDLTDRFLPRLKSRNLKPELLPFLPYTAAQVKAIIIKRLKSLLPEHKADSDYIPFFHPVAIELCSRKVSSQTGDLRKAFGICRRALDMVENETRIKLENEAKDQVLQMTPSRKILSQVDNQSSPGKKSNAGAGRSVTSILAGSINALTVETAPRVSIAHLNKVTSAAFSNGTNQRLKTLNLQQKAALCALHALERRNREAIRTSTPTTPSTPSSKANVTAPTIKTLFDTYAILCKRSDAVVLHPLSSSEFREVMGSLETLSLVAGVDGKNGSFVSTSSQSGGTPGARKRRKTNFVGGSIDDKRVASCVGEKELEQAADGPGADILRSILSGEALD